MIENKNNKEKYVYLDALRIIAVFFVIFNHTDTSGFVLFTQVSPDKPQFWAYLFISIFCRFSVPVFLAISGALLLGRDDEGLKKLWSKRISKIAFLLAVYSVVYYLYHLYVKQGKFEWKDFLIQTYTSENNAHLWYLYFFIAYLIGLPFLRALVKTLDTKYYYYLIAIALFYNALLPIVEYLVGQGQYSINNYLRVTWLINRSVLYPCMGYFMHNKLDIRKMGRKIPVLWALNILGILLCCYLTYYKGITTGVFSENDSQTFHNSFALLNCITIFLSVKYLFEKIKLPQKAERFVFSMGKCTLGIYLMHVLVKNQKFMEAFLRTMIHHGVNSMLAILIQCFVILMICYVITWIMMKIPVLRKLVGG